MVPTLPSAWKLADLQTNLDALRLRVEEQERRIVELELDRGGRSSPRHEASAHEAPVPVVTLRSMVEEEELVEAARGEGVRRELQPRFWDLALFVGTGALGPLASLLVCLLLVLNAAGQLLFLWVVAFGRNSFLNRPEPGRAALEVWRTSVGHAYRNVAGENSLVSRVCHEDPGLGVASQQVELIQEAGAYLTEVLGLEVGPTLCMFCLLLWEVTTLVPVDQLFSLVFALWCLPKGRTRLRPKENGALELESISKVRFWAMALLSCARLAIVVGLLVIGCIWLAKTSSLEELLYNAVALSLVLELDELLFSSLAPDTGKVIIAKTRPLQGPRPRHWKGLGAKPVLLLLAALALTAGVRLTEVEKTRGRLMMSNSTLCGGDQDFVHDDSKGTHILLTSTVPWRPLDEGKFPLMQDIVHAHAWGRPGKNVMNLENVTGLAFYSSLTATEFAVWSCEDQPEETLLFSMKVVGLALHHRTGLQGASSCRDFLPACDRHYNPLVRMLCPQTCGCRSPASGMRTRQGCPPSCPLHEDYRSQLEQNNCTDLPAELAAAHPGWRRLQTTSMPWNKVWGHPAVKDCRDVTPALCLPLQQARWGSFRPFCPQACGCRQGDPDCPRSCPP